MWAFVGFVLIMLALLSIEGLLRKGHKQNEEIIGLLEQIKDKL